MVTASVVAIDQPITYNRLGAYIPNGMIFALQGDVCPGGQATCPDAKLADLVAAAKSSTGVSLRDGKRPRPLVLRVNEGQCLAIRFTNLLTPAAPSSCLPASNPACAGVGGSCCDWGLGATATACPTSGKCVASPVATTTRAASIHAQGLEWVKDSCDDGSWVGKNPSSLVKTGETKIYTLFAAHEGTYLLYSTGDDFSGAPDGGQLQQGLFGAMHVEPAGAEWYRSQVTEQDLCLASEGSTWDPQAGCTRQSPGQLPIIDYTAVYPVGHPRAGLPILNMRCPAGSTACVPGEIVASDLTAIITGQNAGRFPATGDRRPVFNPAYALPDRLQPYREFTIIYHEVFQANQPFSSLYNEVLNFDGDGADNFAFNYGMGGIGSEILANRLGVGPMGGCTGCKYEEFFLSSWAVGDPAMVVDLPATQSCDTTFTCSSSGADCDPTSSTACPTGQSCLASSTTCDQTLKATKAYYPDDPSNVYHSYIADHTKFRILHGGQDLHHLHHQHAHQWMHSPNTPSGDYPDSQAIGPGSAFTLEMVYNGWGNVNQTVGDSIFHCHFYPHFAGGMWSLWRVHDVLETGTKLDATGRPVTSRLPGTGAQVTTTRALPDGEIATGTPIPAVVPVPTIPMAPLPAEVWLTDGGKRVSICRTTGGTTTCMPNTEPVDPKLGGTPAGWTNPGYPFFVPGLGGQRAPHPPMDFAYACSDNHQPCTPAFGGRPADLSACGAGATCEPLDGGLPRHLIAACPAGETCFEMPDLSPVDFSKTLTEVDAFRLPEEGTVAEQVAMQAHAQRFVPSRTPEGSDRTWDAHKDTYRKADFVLNGLPPIQGAPYADPCINYSLRGGAAPGATRRYFAAVLQTDAVFSKQGWHFPQQRMLSLWGDVVDALTGKRAPEPLFFRANSGDCIEYVHANLVPNVYELDDFQVRTPTDILGQHIHLVKFDVTSSDGAGNGFNYEDGTFSPDEVTERIRAINAGGGLAPTAAGGKGVPLTAEPLPFFGTGPGGRWMGAQATVQRFYADPLFDGPTYDPPAPGAKDRTLRTVFTHDHFGPSTHQQVGLYAGLVVEPAGSKWYLNEAPGTGPFGGAGVPSRVVTGPGGAKVADGGPTTWQAVIEPPDAAASFREFLFTIQDTVLTYEAFDDVLPVDHGGFCGNDVSRPCVPATLTRPASGCSGGAVCYARGFCSDDPTKPCRPGTWQTAEDVSHCKVPATATCNFVAGVPGQVIAAYPFNTQPPVTFSDVYTWGSSPIDYPGKKGPEIIAFSGGTNSFSMNYRNEPLWPRIIDPSTSEPASGDAGDLAFAFQSIARPSFQYGFCDAVPGLGCSYCSDNGAACTAEDLTRCADPGNAFCGPYPPLSRNAGANDPWTPLLRTYAGDDVQVRTLIGAHINPHNFTLHGLKWLMEPSMVDSGWRSSQVMGISEHFEQLVRMPSWVGGTSKIADYLYMGGASAVEVAGGDWGLIRAYGQRQDDLRLLPQNRAPEKSVAVCPHDAPRREYTVVALTAQQALGGPLVYNSRGTTIEDSNAVLYFKLGDLTCTTPSSSCTAKSTTPQPLVLRANAGECIHVTLYNGLSASASLGTGAAAPNLPPSSYTAADLTGGPVAPCGVQSTDPCWPSNVSTYVGLHPQLVAYDVTTSDGFNAGTNSTQTVTPSGHTTYVWYAGNVDVRSDGGAHHIPLELGAANLLPADVVNHFQHGLFGGLIIEPAGSRWDPAAGTIADVFAADGRKLFREFVVLTQDGLGTTQASSTAPNLVTPTMVSGNLNLEAVNYGSEPLGSRSCPTKGDVSCVLSDSATCGSTTCGKPQTPVFTACAGEPVRFRLLHPGGINTDQVFELYGHVWAETPYYSSGPGCVSPTTHTNLRSSSHIGEDHVCTGLSGFGPVQDSLSDWQGSRMGHGPGNHGDVLVRAGGANAVPGDYLYKTYPAMHFVNGLWGIFRVEQCSDYGQARAAAAGAAP